MILRNKSDNPELAPLSPWQAGHDYDTELHGDDEAPAPEWGMALATAIAIAFVVVGAGLVLQWLVDWIPV